MTEHPDRRSHQQREVQRQSQPLPRRFGANRTTFDVAVVGAGVVGLSAGVAALRAGYRTLVIDPKEAHPVLGTEFDLRTYALSPASMRLLQRLGVADALVAERVSPFEGMYVWDAGSSGQLRFTAAALGRPQLGFIVEQANLIAALDYAMSRYDGIERMAESVSAIENSETKVDLSLRSGLRLSAQLVIACDGAQSTVRQLLGLDARPHDYAQSALVCNIETQESHGRIARQRFLDDGPLALLPLPDPHRSAVVWSLAPATAERYSREADDAFMASLATASERALGAIVGTSPRARFPLQRLVAMQSVRGRVALLGDAAHVIHPLAGQGLNLGLMDVAALVDVLPDKEGSSLRFIKPALRRLERIRHTETLAMLAVTDRLNALFRNRSLWNRQMRGLGMRAVDRLSPLKHWLILRAMGDVGDVPASARPGGKGMRESRAR